MLIHNCFLLNFREKDVNVVSAVLKKQADLGKIEDGAGSMKTEKPEKGSGKGVMIGVFFIQFSKVVFLL